MTTLESLATTREDLDPRARECLACYVDRLLASSDCAGDIALVRWWQRLRAPRATGLPTRLASFGVTCDCEVLALAYEHEPSLTGRSWGPWERPGCRGVHHGSAQPCGRWRRRRRWQHDPQETDAKAAG